MPSIISATTFLGSLMIFFRISPILPPPVSSCSSIGHVVDDDEQDDAREQDRKAQWKDRCVNGWHSIRKPTRMSPLATR